MSFQDKFNSKVGKELDQVTPAQEVPLTQARNSGFKWEHKLPMVRAYQMSDFYWKRYKIRPNASDVNPGGMILWTNPPSKMGTKYHYDNLMIWDMALPHLRPAPHIDFLFLTIKLPIPADKVPDLWNISDSISYYPLGGLLTAGCHRIQASVATFVVVKLFAEGHISLTQARDLYGPYIMMLFKEFDQVQEDLNALTPMYDLFESYLFDLIPGKKVLQK